MSCDFSRALQMHLKMLGGYYSKRLQTYTPKNNPLPILRLLTVTFSSC